MRKELLEIMNACLKFEVIPNQWKIAKLVILSKGQDKDPTNSSSYRLIHPRICVLSVLGKILESLMAIRLREIIEQHLGDTQYRFRKGRPQNTTYTP